MRVLHFFDYKSPYAYLAQETVHQLARESGVDIEWRPLTLDIPQFLGRAELGEDGQDILHARNAHQWRRVRYSYMDCRREANRRGITLLGPRRIFDSSVAHIGFLFAQERGEPERYHERAYERFFRRELDVGDRVAVTALLAECGIPTDDFAAYLEGPGRETLDRYQREAEEDGVFGVPSFLIDGELFWGEERFPRVREALGISS